MSAENELLKSGQQEETQSEPIRLETEEVFDLEKLEPDLFQDDPLKMYASLVSDLKHMASCFMRPSPIIAYAPPEQDHKVRIFRVYDQMRLTEVESQIESILNEGWCCHHPVVVGDFLIMDFSRRKETEENER